MGPGRKGRKISTFQGGEARAQRAVLQCDSTLASVAFANLFRTPQMRLNQQFKLLVWARSGENITIDDVGWRSFDSEIFVFGVVFKNPECSMDKTEGEEHASQ